MDKDFAINIDHSDINQQLKHLRKVKNGIPRALMRATNRTLQGMSTDAGKQIVGGTGIARRYLKITQRDVKAELNAKDKATLSDLSASMTSEGRPIRSALFKYRKNTRQGVKGGKAAFLQIKKSSAGRRLDGDVFSSKAFVATMPNGMTGLFRRTGEKTNTSKESTRIRTGKAASRYLRRTYTNKGREKIEQIYSPGVVQMLDNKKVRSAIQDNAVERFNKELDHQVKYILEQESPL